MALLFSNAGITSGYRLCGVRKAFKMDETQRRVKEAVDNMIDDVDKSHLRDLQKNMFTCSAKCCEDKKSSREVVEKCVDLCNSGMKKAQATLEQELGALQNQLSHCAMKCYDNLVREQGVEPNKFTDAQMLSFNEKLNKNDMMKAFYIILSVILFEAAVAGDDNIGGLNGRVCAFGDMNKDRYTDMIVQTDTLLRINIQGENGQFTESSRLHPINIGVSAPVSCVVGDFNGDSIPDIMVSKQSLQKDNQYETTVYIFKYNAYMPVPINVSYFDQPSVVDVNGDGISDIIGFVYGEDDQIRFHCAQGMKSLNEFTQNCTDAFTPINNSTTLKPIRGFPHFFADINGDLSAEIVFAMEDEKRGIRLDVWKRISAEKWEYMNNTLIKPIPLNSNFKYFGGAVVGDIDANGGMDIMIPVCREEKCSHVDNMLLWTLEHGWSQFGIDLKESEVVSESDSKVLFRIGDFTLDGYPDLIASIRMPNQRVYPMILENIPVSDLPNVTRKFELKTSPRLVEPGEMALGDISMVSFFDLKEDGSLDILVEYKYDLKLKHDFIRCEDKGDTTFLKVQTFTSVCSSECPGSDKKDLGSGIAWHGACAHFIMADSWGERKMSVQCQMPQTSHRSLGTPYTLFGLGRSPNFVDAIRIGSPRYPGIGPRAQRTELKQVVPNSRLIVIPPDDPTGTYWQTRLYVTPSRLIIQSLLVLISVCVLLILLVGYLHFRERKEDRRERQMQSHRFHFDAL
ncbi:hypothetical protein QR680_013290 [Steinernema hermaphroditum]|uniref:T-cell immunomodulatory protein TIP C2 domain-containing protein n=1 Tax=Steinernema hermaphroditum TaxID=289476 RepID=A0AA39I7M2_9BILA|nr:hypothetical protein QR680_013290 [Steinernema hermaphroditum]